MTHFLLLNNLPILISLTLICSAILWYFRIELKHIFPSHYYTLNINCLIIDKMLWCFHSYLHNRYDSNTTLLQLNIRGIISPKFKLWALENQPTYNILGFDPSSTILYICHHGPLIYLFSFIELLQGEANATSCI